MSKQHKFAKAPRAGSKAAEVLDFCLENHNKVDTDSLIQAIADNWGWPVSQAKLYHATAMGRIQYLHSANNPGEEFETMQAVEEHVLAREAGTNKVVTDFTAGINLPAPVDPNYDPNKDVDDETLLEDIRDKFETLEEIAQMVFDGHANAMVITGDGGLGKSHHLELVDERNGHQAEHIKGTMGAIGMYMALFNNSSKGQVMVLDDCDGLMFDPDALNLLKAATDTKRERWVSYRKETRVLKEEDIPQTFQFNGSVIIVTNVDFEAQLERDSKVSSHLEALMTRCQYVDVMLRSKREKLLRMTDVIKRGGMLREMGCNDEQEDDVLNFIEKHSDEMRDLSLRAAINVARLRISTPNWERNAIKSIVKQRHTRF